MAKLQELRWNPGEGCYDYRGGEKVEGRVLPYGQPDIIEIGSQSSEEIYEVMGGKIRKVSIDLEGKANAFIRNPVPVGRKTCIAIQYLKIEQPATSEPVASRGSLKMNGIHDQLTADGMRYSKGANTFTEIQDINRAAEFVESRVGAVVLTSKLAGVKEVDQDKRYSIYVEKIPENEYWLVTDRSNGRSINVITKLPDKDAREGGCDYTPISEKEARKHIDALRRTGVNIDIPEGEKR